MAVVSQAKSDSVLRPLAKMLSLKAISSTSDELFAAMKILLKRIQDLPPFEACLSKGSEAKQLYHDVPRLMSISRAAGVATLRALETSSGLGISAVLRQGEGHR